ncbi:hypothetical protein BT96DRAFT_1074203 [Gymnopus androsaceus JB14]|uniref:Uncharacterized protein n=1 Tax=Gymnopus androsaceus JB14 TaxID=1447944 RepID=A0A6A4GRF3_9AGAR|nr:hypothetical protein BT96DRAFT_1074203 [Gymnopus androsaceus JB14]
MCPGYGVRIEIEIWQVVTDAVHAKGSFIVLQLWALGLLRAWSSSTPRIPYHTTLPRTSLYQYSIPPPLTINEIAEYRATYTPPLPRILSKWDSTQSKFTVQMNIFGVYFID